MSTVAAEPSRSTVNGGLAYPPFGEGDKYRGAVVEVCILDFGARRDERRM